MYKFPQLSFPIIGYSILSFLLLTCTLLSLYLPVVISTDALQINLVGRQRMLTEQMLALTLALKAPNHYTLNNAQLQSELTDSIDLFNSSLLSFVKGGKTRDSLGQLINLPPLNLANTASLLKEAQTTWSAYQKQLQTVLDSSPDSNESIRGLFELNAQQVQLMNRLTYEIETATESRTQVILQTRNVALSLLIAVVIAFLKKKQKQKQQLIDLYERCLAKANDIVIITEAEPIDLPGPPIVYVNNAFERITGYSREEAIGNNPRMLQGEKTDRATLDKIRNALSKWQPIRCEVLNYTKSGEKFWLELDITPIANETGWFTHWLYIQRDISARKTLEQRLDDLNQQHKTIINAVPALISYWDKNLRNGFANQAYLDWFGTDPANLKGIHAKDFLGDTIYALEKPYMDGALQGQMQRFEQRFCSPNGQSCEDVPCKDAIIEFIPHVQDNAVAGFYVIAFDVTDLKQAQAAAKTSLDKLQKLYDLSPLGIALVDMKGRFLEFNAKFSEITGYASDELHQLDFWQLTPEKYKEQELQQLTLLQTTGKYGSYEKEYRQKDETLIPVVLNGVKITDDDGNEYIWSIVEEITERRKSEQQLVKLKEAAESLAQAKSDFLANMSHEIRTPMNAIMGFCQLLLYKDHPPEVRDYLEKITTASNSLMNIVNDVLDFSKLDTGKFSLNIIWFKLDTLISNLNALFAETATQKGIVFEIYRDTQIPNELKGDSIRIQQVLANLISNAIKFTEHGKVSLNINLLTTESRSANILFSVQDSGIGIAKEQQSKLFQSFTQADNSSTRRYGGMGLGLSISEQLLHLMGSQFKLTSAVGLGSKFNFELLLLTKPQSKQSAIQASVSHNNVLTCFPQLGGHVLVVEDNHLNQVIISKFLNLSGLTVDNAKNGKEALELLAENHYDAILMDIHMPVMNGIEATEHIRSQAQFAKLPIIALTADTTEKERELCFNVGMNAFLSKPFKPQEILTTLTEWLA